ncbi:MAG: alkaline phosphatase family protein [Acidobacteriia bacterium]|nr:alkaline phosphatase family protein [Terriglobia bacterium]
MGICRREFGACILGALASQAFALPTRPKLLVLVLIEQLRADAIDAAWSQFGTGGFRRLLEKGAYFADCRHLASAFPATGIATLATGAWPSQHGIVADSWYDRAAHRPVSASDEDLLATTLAAQLAADARARVFVVAMNQAHGALFAGSPAAQLFWMDERGTFSARGEAPDWLADYNSAKGPESAHAQRWMALGVKPDAAALRILTYDAERPQEFLALYKASPFGQGAQYDFLGELMARQRIGQGSTFDFVCLLDGSTGQLGYETGGNSPLMQQMVLRLDIRLEALLAGLTHTLGENGFNLVLAAAHGAPPEPAEESRARMAVSGEAVAESVEKSLAAAGNGRVEKYLYPFLYLDTSGFRDPEPVRVAAARAAFEHRAVAGYYTAGGACSTRDEWQQRFRNSFHPKRSGDVMLSYRAEYVEDFGAGRGVSYGSLYNYDVRVPLCFYGPQFRAGVFESPVASVDVAPTLARAMGIAAPSSAIGRVLGEAFPE